MNKDDSERSIKHLDTVISLLEKKWPRPQSDIESKVIAQLIMVRDALRETQQIESPGEA